MMSDKIPNKVLTLLLSLNMAFSGMPGDMGSYQVHAETENEPLLQTMPAADAVPVLSSVKTRNLEDSEQTEIYRFHIAKEETISLRDALIRSGCASEDSADAFLEAVTDISVEEESPLLVETGEDGTRTITAQSSFDGTQTIGIETGETMTYLQVTDVTVEPVSAFVSGDHTGSVSVRAADGSAFSEEVTVDASVTEDSAAVEAVLAQNVISAEYITFAVNASEEKPGYTVNFVFPEAVKGNGYYLFGADGSLLEGSVVTTEVNGETVAAGVQFDTDALGTFVFAYTQTDVIDSEYRYELTGSEALDLRALIVGAGMASEETADAFLANLTAAESADPQLLSVEMIENACLIHPGSPFTETTLTLTTRFNQTITLTVADQRPAPEPSAEPAEETAEPEEKPQEGIITQEADLTASDGKKYHFALSYGPDAKIPADAVLTVAEVADGAAYIEQGAEKLGDRAEDVVAAKAFDIALRNPETQEEYIPEEAVQVSITLLEDSIQNYTDINIVHISEEEEKEDELVVTEAADESTLVFAAEHFSIFVVYFMAEPEWGDYTYTMEGGEQILLSELLTKLGVTKITVSDVDNVVFSNKEYVTVETLDGDWMLHSVAPFETEETLTLGLHKGTNVEIKVQCKQSVPANVKITSAEGTYDAESESITYTVTVEAEGSVETEVSIKGLAPEDPAVLKFVSGSYVYTHKDGFVFPDGSSEPPVSGTKTQFDEFPVTLSRMFDGDTVTLTYTAKVNHAAFDAASGAAVVTNTASVACPGTEQDTGDDSAPVTTQIEYEPVVKTLTDLDGSWASYTVSVNPKGYTLNGGEPVTLRDTFTANQSIDYASILVSEGITYDYSDRTGTFVIPDNTPAVITYRARITAEAGDNVKFGNTAELLAADGTVIDQTVFETTHVIYPSASDVATQTGTYMLKLFVYRNSNMQEGLPDAVFALLDENQRPITYKKGTNAGNPVHFVTDENGYADIALDEETDGVAVEKNTGYFLEMVSAPSGYRKDNTLYSFMITDNPGYDSGGVWTYYNGDTMKVRLYEDEPGVNVSLRFAGNHELTEEQRNNITVTLQKKGDDGFWTDLETHAYTDFSYGAIKFDTLPQAGATYRVVQANERPWDLDESIALTATYFLGYGSGTSEEFAYAPEFAVTEETASSSINLVIKDEYDEHKLIITKMDKETGHHLPGALFEVKKAKDDSFLISGRTDEHGQVIISGGEIFESETLYYAVETEAPEGYYLPDEPDKIYFYFCNDPALIPSIIADLPAGETAVNLTETYDSLTLDNKKNVITVPVMKTWQGNTWPQGYEVTIGLYQSVNGSEPEPVKDSETQEPLRITLSADRPFDNHAFTDLPAKDTENRKITYSIKEESVMDGDTERISEYVQEYGISDAGVYIVRNKVATSFTVKKKWVDLEGREITDAAELAEQSDVTFDVYRSTEQIPEEIQADGITGEEMAAFVRTLRRVRTNQTFGNADNWTKTLDDLDLKDNFNNKYYYYAVETVPSFGGEIYEVQGSGETMLITNQLPPETVPVTITKAKLVKDPRPDAADTDFTFRLKLTGNVGPIRQYTVADDLKTDWNGEVTFTLKPEHSLELALPKGVTAEVSEAVNPQYSVSVTGVDGSTVEDSKTQFTVAEAGTVTFTNTLHVICKVNNGTEDIAFESLKSALAYIRDHSDVFGGTAVIEMLEDYVMPESDAFSVQDGETITLTTATTDTSEPFHFTTDRTDYPSTALITRGKSSGSLLENAGTLNLKNIILDGANTAVNTDGGLVQSSGELNLSDLVILRNSRVSGKGGAIYASGAVAVTDRTLITGNAASSGSAIYLGDNAELNLTGGSITENIGAGDGAVVIENLSSRIHLSGSPVITGNKNASGNDANLYIGVNNNTAVQVTDPGLLSEAQIGVTALAGHIEIGDLFASTTYGYSDNLDTFVNDLYGYHGKLQDGSNTTIAWEGLTLTVRKSLSGQGTNPDDIFTITLTSPAIRKSTYRIDGTVTPDNIIKPATSTTPGYIVLSAVKADQDVTISPLPVGAYTVAEDDSFYTPTYSVTDESGSTTVITGGSFRLRSDSTVNVRNTRTLVNVDFTTTLSDQLAGSDAVTFPFTVKLTENDGTTPIANFTLAEGIVTNPQGIASYSADLTNGASVVKNFKAPYGALMTITESNTEDYHITASSNVTDEDTENENIFAFAVPKEDVEITFANYRKIAEITLKKELTSKVSKEETFTYHVMLKNSDGSPAADFVMHEGDETIRTDENGRAEIEFTLGENSTSESINLTVPEGTELTVEEEEVRKDVSGSSQAIYDTTYSVNDGTAVTGRTAKITSVTENDRSIEFRNVRKTRNVTVTNTVGGYSGNTVPFTYTASVTDGSDDDYDAYGFEDGELTFELATGQSRVLTVPYGADLKIEQSFIVGYETLIKHGSGAAIVTNPPVDEFQVSQNVTVAFTNNQLINIVLVNNTSVELQNVQVYTAYGSRMYRVNDAGTGQDAVVMNDHWATVSVAAGKKAILEVNHQNSQTYEQDYTVRGSGPEAGYYYTIKNEPSFHEFADPAILRIYDTNPFEVKGKLRYSVSDSTVTFTEQPLVSFDANGGAWTTEMEGYRDRDGNRKVYQKAVNKGETAAEPLPSPIYPTSEGITFLGWTADEAFAKAPHTEGEDISAKAYDFNTPVTAPVTLYAVWTKEARDTRIVTVKNAVMDRLTVSVTLTGSDGQPVRNYRIAEGVTTDNNGGASIAIDAGAFKNLTVPDRAKLVLSSDSTGIGTYSSDFTDADNVQNSFTISAVEQDGTVSFISGIIKITDIDGNVLYQENSRPAVYMRLSDAFTAYVGNLYTTQAHDVPATPAAVKLLVDDYDIQQAAALVFPNAEMTLTTAGKDDAQFPYIGNRSKATIYRYGNGNSYSCFSLTGSNSDITLTDIILDGGSELGRKAEQATNGSLINVSGGTLTVSHGTVMRNSESKAYNDGNWGRGGAIYLSNGTVNVNAGLFSNLHARRGGAISAVGGTLNVTGSNGSTRFENCDSNGDDGGAIAWKVNAALNINGGNDRSKPGIIFTGCTAKSTAGEGGAIYADTSYNHMVTVTGCEFTECSSRVKGLSNTGGYGGGAVAAWHVKGLDVSSSSFTSCDTMMCGGAIVAYVKTTTSNPEADRKEISIADCTFDFCNCKAQGGAVAVYQDNNGASASTTRLSIENSVFSNCSSGTDNGSGGAIQCYLPCIEFTDSSFTDCWAGKEGGAVNIFFGANYAEMWNNSYMNVTNCHFTRCRAEDRYDLTGLVHYGGAINTKVQKVQVTNSTFEDCVSTLREGGALHLGGIGANSSATITGSTFKNCMAKEEGGAVLASNESLTITDSRFYGCSSFAESGGAVFHGQNSRNTSTQKNTTISDCVFSSDPEGGDDAVSCGAAKNGGAIWTRANTAVSIANNVISGCTAGGNGGAVYQAVNGTSTAVYSGGSITYCEAVNGSAVYLENKASGTFSGISITGNTASASAGGAVAGGAAGDMYFEGKVTVTGNTCSSDSSCEHNVVLANDSNTIIRTTAKGLDGNAAVGIYVTDAANVFVKHGNESQPFGTYANDSGNLNLECFRNDRVEGLYGYQASASSPQLIYWGQYLCKITDAEGNTLKRPSGKDAVYQRLSMALDEFPQVRGGKPVYIKMLVQDYPLQQQESITNFPAADITLTTASADDAEHRYRGEPGTFCTISRDTRYNSANQLFKLNNADTTFRLENIVLDGRKNKTAETGDLRLIEVQNGSLVIGSGTTLQYGYTAGNNTGGGAILVNSINASLTINSTEDGDVVFDHCVMKDSQNYGGGAVYSLNSVTITSDGKGRTLFSDCSARRGGAIMINNNSSEVNLNINGAEFKNCHSPNEGGAIYVNNNNTAANTNIANSVFEGCYTDSNARYSYGGAVNSKAGTLSIKDSAFKDCYARSSGGAVNHGSENSNRQKTEIIRTTFDNCRTTGTDNSYGYGGAVYTQAIAVEVTDSRFNNSTAYNNGGALYCESNHNSSVTTISGTTMKNSTVTRNNGYGGAIFTRGRTLTLQNSENGPSGIENSVAKGYSGAVHMDSANSTLNITGSTLISGNYANRGGAIYLKNSVVMNVSGSPEFTKNGYTTLSGSSVSADRGANIYLEEGSRINLSGSPKFSRNILPDKPRIINGAVTDYVRQDLYLAGYTGTSAVSIHVAGELTDGDTIWVWPENVPHRVAGDQFATTEAGVSAASLEKFRNGLADGDTDCSNGEYLAGVRMGTDVTNVYWSKMYNIFFNKKDNKRAAVVGAEFTMYKDPEFTEKAYSSTSADGIYDTNAHGELLEKGVVDFPSVPIGVYYMKETFTPAAYKQNSTEYIVLVGSPALYPDSEVFSYLWNGDGPLNVRDAKTLVPQNTVESGKYYGIFALDSEGKADVTANLALETFGITNIRDDHEVEFMKLDNNGSALPDAKFTVFVQETDSTGQGITYANGYPKLTVWERDGRETTAESADGSTQHRKLDGTIVPKGVVYFPEIPVGTFYLMETYYPERNGDNRITFFVEQDRVFRLDVRGANSFEMSEWQEGGSYTPLEADSTGEYIIRNREAVAKLTDADNRLLYTLGHDGVTRIPAIYATLEEGFEAADHGVLYDAAGNIKADADRNPDLKLKALKDFTLTEPINYDSARALTFTTAERSAPSDNDRYIFSTTRTADTSRAEVRRGYDADTSADPDSGALITVSGSAKLTLQNIRLNGRKNLYNGRAIHVTGSGSLTVLNNTQIQSFKQEGESASVIRGGAIRADSGTTLYINGGSANRSALFTDNEVKNNGTGGSESGAVALGENCTVTFMNAQFTGNRASAEAAEQGSGGAISLPASAADQTFTFTNVVFRNNTAAHDGGAINTKAGSHVSIVNSIFTGNSADNEGGAVRLAEGSTLNVSGNTSITGNGAARGGAVYTAAGASAAFTAGRITGNSGGAVYTADGTSRLYFGGSIYIFDNLDNGVQKNVVLNADSNDVINTTDGGLFSNAYIGVYVNDGTEGTWFRKHGLAGMPFGTFSGSANLDKFVNDRNLSLYGVRHETDEGDVLIYWINIGGSVAFKKIDSFGEAVSGAAFTLYTDNACTEVYEKPSGDAASVVSANGTSDRNTNGDLLKKGTVLFEAIPDGVYYMKETKSDKSSGAPAGFAENTAVYIVLVGDSAMIRPADTRGTIWASGNVLGAITQEMVNAQKTRYTADKDYYFLGSDPNYAVFRIDAETKKADAVPDIAQYGVMNEPEGLYKAVIRKNDAGLDPVEGAVFDVLAYDRTVIAKDVTSRLNGVIWIGNLAPGKYYLHETTVPAGYAAGADGTNWFEFTVTKEGQVGPTAVKQP